MFTKSFLLYCLPGAFIIVAFYFPFLNFFLFFFQKSIYLIRFTSDIQILASLRGKITDQEDISKWILDNFAEVSNCYFCMPDFENCFPPHSAQQPGRYCLDSHLPFLCSLTLFWHHILLSLLNEFFPFYYFLPSLFLSFHLCWCFYDCLSYIYFLNVMNICCITFSKIIWKKGLFPIFPICFLFSYSKKS